MLFQIYSNKSLLFINILWTDQLNKSDTYLHSINNWISIVTLEFNDEELKRWKDLCQSYDKTREKIFKVESILK